jgi:hypothetical protein
LFDQSFTIMGRLVPFRAYGVNNSIEKTWSKVAMIILCQRRRDGWMDEVLATQGLRHPNPRKKFARE